MFTAGGAQAGIAGSSVPTFPTAVTVGGSYSASIRIGNPNSSNVSNTVCNLGDGGVCSGDPGILLMPTCGKFAGDAICDPSGYDPDVYQVSATGTGTASAVPGAPAVDPNGCNGWVFNIVKANNTTGEYRFTPAAPHTNVVLPKDGYCEINFTFLVLKMPTVDYSSTVAGFQTVPIVRSEQTDGVSPGFGR
ncbi:MAG: hypothetical protein JWL72_3803, partial [Ilumatobacteraceae bacterium]|nr:hypothetical protein [Ilumatobacteraceae bacterium]